MICIFGLGNPGIKYKKTRHNAGFRVIDLLAKEYGIRMRGSKFQAKIGEGRVHGKKILLVKPQTYMNDSGWSVSAILDYFKVPTRDMVVLVDDMDLTLGAIRIRENGGAGGHNGLKSIISYLKNEDFTRIRIGIGKPEGCKGAVPHVLGKFSGDEGTLAEQTFMRCARAIDCLIGEGAAMAQSKYNG
jgi:PTH1 family peptidyl-tRNA hydrolase